MKIALILDPDIIDDLPRRDRLVETLRHTKGVLGLDVEMADSGLLLANVNKSMETKTLEELEGIERVSPMGVKHAVVGPNRSNV